MEDPLLSIRGQLLDQAERFLRYIAQDMHGKTIQAWYCIQDGEEEFAHLIDFIRGQLNINFKYYPKRQGVIEIYIYKIHEPDKFEMMFYENPGSRLYNLIPEEITRALKECIEQKQDVELNA